MKHLKTAVFGLVFSLISLIPGYSSRASLGDLHLSYLKGDVQVRTGEASEWFPASINMLVKEGDAIWIPEGGRAGILLRDGTQVRLDAKSSLEVLTIGRDSNQFYLSLGHAYVNFSGRRDTLLQVDTPVSSTRAYARAKFRVDVDDKGFTDVAVFSGVVATEGGGGETKVAGGKILSLGENNSAELALLGPADGWERWNQEMDRKLGRRYSTRYLPAELNPYAYEFDAHGRWVTTREYGYVWTPAVVSVSWAPYRYGRWTWIGGDYVWVSYDPWGWAPYHYGRWAFVVSIGWCWVPPVRGAVYWSPGYVAWISTPTYVSWLPLAPGEIYYGYGNYGPQSVNLTSININTINITNIYRNAEVAGAYTAVSRDAFVTGRQKDFRVEKNPFLNRQANVGRPDIAPTRESRMPVVKSISAAVEPPEKIKKMEARGLRESRPVVKDPTRSVLRQGSALEPMAVETVKGARRPGTAMRESGKQPGTAEKGVRSRGAATTGRMIEKSGGAPKSRAVERPSGVPTGRKIEKSGSASKGRSVERQSGAPAGRAIRKSSGGAVPRQTLRQAAPHKSQQKKKPPLEEAAVGHGKKK